MGILVFSADDLLKKNVSVRATEVIPIIAMAIGQDNSVVSAVFSELSKQISEVLSAGGKLHVRGVGVFYARKTKPRRMYIPTLKGQKVTSGRMVLSFKPSSKIKIREKPQKRRVDNSSF